MNGIETLRRNPVSTDPLRDAQLEEPEVSEDDEQRAKWLEARTHGLGASDAASIFGISPQRAGYPDGKEPGYPRCPVCGEECESIFADREGAFVGCDMCVVQKDPWEVEDRFPGKEP